MKDSFSTFHRLGNAVAVCEVTGDAFNASGLSRGKVWVTWQNNGTDGVASTHQCFRDLAAYASGSTSNEYLHE
ncbi:hypothetical protein KKK_06095 [Pseudomonas putida B6-2]|nr:hypothetical protein KKK_06095 [Pseudomonas putida B6-2]